MSQKQNRPKFLYHGSPRRDIEVFEPRVSRGSGEKYGAQVYATHDLTTAIAFLAHVETAWASGRFGNVLYALIPMDREEFIKKDMGGCIYVLPSKGFETNPERGMREFEWANPNPVKPIKKIEYNSSLAAMLEHGIQVYFVDTPTFTKIQKSDDHGYAILKKLQSENQRRDSLAIPSISQ